MKQVNSVLDFADNGIADRLQHELQKTIENINDPNTDLKPRTINIKLTLTPGKDRSLVSITGQVSKVIRPYLPCETTVKVIGNSLTELSAFSDWQVSIEGEVLEQKQLKFRSEDK